MRSPPPDMPSLRVTDGARLVNRFSNPVSPFLARTVENQAHPLQAAAFAGLVFLIAGCAPLKVEKGKVEKNYSKFGGEGMTWAKGLVRIAGRIFPNEEFG